MQGGVAGDGTFNDGLSAPKNYVTDPPTSSVGSGNAHNNTQPTMVVNYFIRIN
jgi:microcystin-dependent protein